MSTAILPVPPLPECHPATPVAVPATVFLPKEHGSWSLALEPLALGLLVAPSWAGGALAGVVLAGFFARRPLKAALVPACSLRRVVARETLVMWSALVVAGLFEVAVLAPWTALWPLLPVAGLGAVFLHCDAQGESRAAGAEVAGSAAFALVPAALATLAGWPPAGALALAGVALARSVPAVLTVRGYLRLRKDGTPAGGWAILSAGVAALLLAALGRFCGVPWIAAGCGGLLLLRTFWLLGPWRPAWPARHVGMFEAVAGLLYVGVITAAYSS
jgi:hypothetical protein